MTTATISAPAGPASLLRPVLCWAATAGDADTLKGEALRMLQGHPELVGISEIRGTSGTLAAADVQNACLVIVRELKDDQSASLGAAALAGQHAAKVFPLSTTESVCAALEHLARIRFDDAGTNSVLWIVDDDPCRFATDGKYGQLACTALTVIPSQLTPENAPHALALWQRWIWDFAERSRVPMQMLLDNVIKDEFGTVRWRRFGMQVGDALRGRFPNAMISAASDKVKEPGPNGFANAAGVGPLRLPHTEERGPGLLADDKPDPCLGLDPRRVEDAKTHEPVLVVSEDLALASCVGKFIRRKHKPTGRRPLALPKSPSSGPLASDLAAFDACFHQKPSDAALRHMLILGETGTGKEALLQMFLTRVGSGDSATEAAPHLLRVELFGAKKGSYTDCNVDRIGMFETYEAGGAILLDEAHNLCMEAQAQLLLSLESGVFKPLGEKKTLKSQARVVAAMNIDPSTAMRAGTLRPDFVSRFRLVVTLKPMRRRPIDEFLQSVARAGTIASGKRLTVGALEALAVADLPDNARDLERAFVTAHDQIGVDVLNERVKKSWDRVPNASRTDEVAEAELLGLKLPELEEDLTELLRRHKRAARAIVFKATSDAPKWHFESVLRLPDFQTLARGRPGVVRAYLKELGITTTPAVWRLLAARACNDFGDFAAVVNAVSKRVSGVLDVRDFVIALDLTEQQVVRFSRGGRTPSDALELASKRFPELVTRHVIFSDAYPGLFAGTEGQVWASVAATVAVLSPDNLDSVQRCVWQWAGWTDQLAKSVKDGDVQTWANACGQQDAQAQWLRLLRTSQTPRVAAGDCSLTSEFDASTLEEILTRVLDARKVDLVLQRSSLKVGAAALLDPSDVAPAIVSASWNGQKKRGPSKTSSDIHQVSTALWNGEEPAAGAAVRAAFDGVGKEGFEALHRCGLLPEHTTNRKASSNEPASVLKRLLIAAAPRVSAGATRRNS